MSHSNTKHMTSDEIARLLASNERAILEAQRKAQQLTEENLHLRVALNRRQTGSIYGGFPVGHIIAIVAGSKR